MPQLALLPFLEALSVVLIFLLAIPQPTAAGSIPGEWELVDHIYTPRDKFALSCSGEDILVYGGRLGSSMFTSSLYTYTTNESNLEKLGWHETFAVSEPAPRFGMKLHRFKHATLGDVFYGFGGNTAKTVVSDELIVFIQSLEEWRTFNGGLAVWPSPRSKYGSVSFGDTMVIFHGITERTMTSEVWEYNIKSSVWKLLFSTEDATTKASPSARFDLCCDYLQSEHKTYCFGGTAGSGDMDDLWAFDHNTNTWTMVAVQNNAAKPGARRLASCVMMNATKQFKVFGGWDSAQAQYVANTNVHTVALGSPGTLTWTATSQPAGLTARDSQQMCVNDNGIYLLGGKSSDGRQSDVWLMPPTKEKFEQVHPGGLRPFARSGHNAVVVGELMFILFGKDAATEYNDVWKLDLNTNKWSSVKITSTTQPAPRYGAAALANGEIIIVHGGSVNGEYSKELWTFDTLNGVWSLMSENGAIPAARAFHKIGILTQGKLSDGTPNENAFLLFGGRTDSSSASSDMYIFDLEEQLWSTPAVSGSTISGRRDFAMIVDRATDSILIYGGITSKTTVFDRYRVEWNKQASNGTTLLTVTSLTSTIGANEDVRNYIRSEASVAGVGSHVVICGGAISSSFPTPIAYACHQYDISTGMNTNMTQAPVTFVSGTAVYFENKYLAFGGQYATEGVRRDAYLNHLQVFTFKKVCSQADTAGASATDLKDSNCIHCSEGTLNPATAGSLTCTHAEPGQYARVSYSSPTNCGEGRFNSESGASSAHFCQICPVNHFSNQEGAKECQKCNTTCRLGATSADDTKSETREIPIITTQPKEYSPVPVPYWIYLILSMVVLGSVVGLSTVMLLSSKGKESMRRYYLSPDDERKLESLYELNTKGDPLGIKVMGLQKTLRQFGFGTINAQLVEELFRQFNVDGSSHIDFEELQMIVVECHRKHLVPPSIGTKNYEENYNLFVQWAKDQAAYEKKLEDSTLGKSLEKSKDEESGEYIEESLKIKGPPIPDFHAPQGILATIGRAEFAQIDMFLESHRIGRVGDSIKLQKTTFGGFITAAFYFLVLVLVAALVLTFWFTNMFETRGVIPELSLDKEVTGDFEIRYDIFGAEVEDCVVGVEHEVEGTCKDGNHADAAGATSDEQKTFTFVEEATTCRYSMVNKTCSIIWRCTDCFIKSLHTVTVTFDTNSELSATHQDITISTTSGIQDPNDRSTEVSKATVQFTPSNATVFRGHPAGEIEMRLVPTDFETIKNSLDQSVISDTGYHVQVLNTKKSHEVGNENFNQFFGVPLKVTFTPSDTVLLVSRKPLQTVLQLITSILGSLSGLSGGLLVLVQQYDGHLQRHRNRQIMQKRAKWEADLREENLKQGHSTDDEMSSSARQRRRQSVQCQIDDLELISGLTEYGVTSSEAMLHLQLIRKIVYGPDYSKIFASGVQSNGAVDGGNGGNQPPPQQQGEEEPASPVMEFQRGTVESPVPDEPAEHGDRPVSSLDDPAVDARTSNSSNPFTPTNGTNPAVHDGITVVSVEPPLPGSA